MDHLPNHWLAMMLLALTLGLKHGLDADHLAAIDGLTRFNSRENPPIARWCGVLFSLGHGLVVVAIALGVGTLAQEWQVPTWLEDLGAWISIGFLLVLGTLNLTAVLKTRREQVVQAVVGIRSAVFRRLQRVQHPLRIALVGTLFALSFDTMSQAALFALIGAKFGGWAHALTLGLLFMLGMMATDGLNGLWISRLIQRADGLARIASRVMGIVVSALALSVAAFGIAKYFSPAVERWTEGKELTLGVTVILVLAMSFLIALALARSANVRLPAAADKPRRQYPVEPESSYSSRTP